MEPRPCPLLQQGDAPISFVTHQTKDVCNRILEIMFDHALDKFDDSKERLVAGKQFFLSVINKYVQTGERIEACLPAFPFKSANKVYKVLGSLPDKAEELALERLNNMCVRIKQVYKPGASVTIISDGITYNDLLSISDRETWAYGEALRQMAVEKKFTYIAFARLRDILDYPLPEKMREITYVANCTNFRRLLMNKYGRPGIDIDREIMDNSDTKLTYLGYRKFLESDLRYIFNTGDSAGRNQYKRDVKYLAKQMLIRGYAFAGAVKNAFPNHLRLSIHESIGEHKLSISLLNTRTGYTTPWHCSVAQLANGEWLSAPKGEFEQDPRLELVYENGRPSYFKENLETASMTGINEENASYLKAGKLFNGTQNGYSLPRSIIQENGSSLVTSHGNSSTNSFFKNENSAGSCPVVSFTEQDEPSYGRRLIPQIMDQLAATHPDRIIFSLTTTSSNDLKFKDISAKAFKEAVDKIAWWLYKKIGPSSTVQPIGYIGPHDLRHVLLTYACAKAGYAVLNLSPKNSTKGALAVIDATKCKIWAKASEIDAAPLVEDFLQQRTMNLLQIPLLEYLLDAKNTKPFPYTETFEQAANKPFCYLHTSGSTGVPKPIPWTHALIGTMDAIRLLPSVDGMLPWSHDWKEGDQIYSSFPMCHGAGIIMNILMPALYGLHCVLGPPNVIPNISLIDKLIDCSRINIWSLVPSLADELGEAPDMLTKLKSPPNKFIVASGGPVNPSSTGKVNEAIRVLNLTGTTEGLFIGNLVVDREDWFWFAFHPYSGFEFKEVEPGLFEHWIHRNEHASLFQGIFHTFPEKESINFKDLYRKHPTKPNLWAFGGRNDDLVVLSTGYKIFPQEIEALISTHPAIEGCLAIGSHKTHAGLLIELKDPLVKTDKMTDSIWSTIKAHMSSSKYPVQFSRDYVIFAQPDKPFVRTDKRTIKRKDTLLLYEDYIERLYSIRGNEIAFKVDTSSMLKLQQSVREIFASSLPAIWEASPDDDFFALGLDSLGVSAAIKAIQEATKGLKKLAPRHIYANPTLGKFTAALKSMMAEKEDAKAGRKQIKSRESKMQEMIIQRRAHQSFRLNPLDYISAGTYMWFVFYLPLAAGVTFEEAFENLQKGLDRTLKLMPALGGKLIRCPEDEIGYKNGELSVAVPPLDYPARSRLVYKDLSDVLPSFEALRKGSFVTSALGDVQTLTPNAFCSIGKDILITQANFINGGCIISVNVDHACLDGAGLVIAAKAWAENCRYLQGDSSALCEWYDPMSLDHSIPEVLHELEGYTRPVEEIDASAWDFLPLSPPEDILAKQPTQSGTLPLRFSAERMTPFPNKWKTLSDRKLNRTSLSIPPEKMRKLKEHIARGLEEKAVMPSTSDIVQAFIWRTALKARYAVAKKNGREFGMDECCILEAAADVRPYFSPLLPSSYMGVMLYFNRTSMPIEKLCSTHTSILDIVKVLRSSAARITPSLVHDAFSLLQVVSDYTKTSIASVGLDNMHTMVTNMMLFPLNEINFGERYFANKGSPERMGPVTERQDRLLRFMVIYPLRPDGGVDVSIGTFPEDRKMLLQDDEFTMYADLVDVAA
ncbi:Pyoverdine/dityrosine biosynthesis protein-domain-containing protein [Bipolaris maydis]|nr:Pyoverdine/dityrosine biosynthesis protein-domain-containing protein [Bipolaris maydis]